MMIVRQKLWQYCQLKTSLTIFLGSILFHLYYESVKSKNHEAYGLKQEHLLSGFYAIGQLACFSSDFRNY
jgi:hypothetical protein